jgi:hypothetical protein
LNLRELVGVDWGEFLVIEVLIVSVKNASMVGLSALLIIRGVSKSIVQESRDKHLFQWRSSFELFFFIWALNSGLLFLFMLSFKEFHFFDSGHWLCRSRGVFPGFGLDNIWKVFNKLLLLFKDCLVLCLEIHFWHMLYLRSYFRSL